MSSTCFACKATVLSVAYVDTIRAGDEVKTENGTCLVNPDPDPAGDIQIKHSRWGWEGRFLRGDDPVWGGWARHKRHTCEKPMEGPA